MSFIGTALRTLAILLVATVAFIDNAAAQSARLRGEIESVDGNAIALKTHDGRNVKVLLDDKYTVNHAIVAKLEDLQPGTYVGVGAFPEGDTLKAAHVQIFPPKTGARQGHGPWGADPSGTMTNAPVQAVVVGQSNSTLTLTLQGKTYDIKVGPDTPIVRTVEGDKSLIKKGAWIGISNATEKDGVFSTRQVVVSDDRRYPAR